MNFLEIVQNLGWLAGTPIPTTAVNQTGESLRLVNWVVRAWEDIQNLHTNWAFLRRPLSFVTANSQSYTLTDMGATTLRDLDHRSLRSYITATGVSTEQFLYPVKVWEDFSDQFLFGTRASGRPSHYCMDPGDKSLVFNSNPGVGFTIVGTFYRMPVLMALDADVPACPSNYHMIIVYWALMRYAGYEAASEVAMEANRNYKSLLSAMRKDQLPRITLGRPLA